LLAAGLIPEPYVGTNERDIAWIGHQAWRYEANLPQGPGSEFDRVDLVADGLDTVARIMIDGEQIGETKNQHRSYRFDVTDRVHDGAELSIEFANIYEVTAALRAELGPYPDAYGEPYNLTRKMASNFGWDWGPTVVTAGVWKDLRLEAWNTARLAEVRPHARLDSPTGDHGLVAIDLLVERSAQGEATPLTVTAQLVDQNGIGVGRSVGRIAPGQTQIQLNIDAGAVQRWWPWDMGDQPLYRLVLTLEPAVDESPIGSSGPMDETSFGDPSASSENPAHVTNLDPEPAVLDLWERSIGFRDIELQADLDEDGSQFTLTVAGRPIFAKGFNWIPNDLLIHRVTSQDYRARLLDAKACGASLIRVWGGGIFEKDEFYDVCDELGLLVWQDCLFACAAYPETEDFTAEVAAEAHDNALRLMPHPSLAVWNGCNENIWGHEDWGWKDVLGDKGWGAKFYFETIPAVLSELDPDRPYWPGSPYSGDDEHHPNDPDYGCSHSWDAWNQIDYTHYMSSRPRFVSEFGWCGPAAWSTMRAAVGDEHMRMWDPVYMWHYKSQQGEPKLSRAVADGFSEPVDFDTWHYAQQVQQARAVRFGIEWWRSLWPRCAGAVVWQLNDCWPVTSWAVVDSAGIRKPAWYSTREGLADQLAVVFPGSEGYELSLVNQGESDWLAEPVLRRVSLAGQVRATWTESILVPAGQVLRRVLPVDIAPRPTPVIDALGGQVYACGLGDDEILVVDVAGDERARSASMTRRQVVARPDKDIHHVPPVYDLAVQPTADGGILTVTARTVLRDLLFQADRLGGTAPLELVTLLPGESHSWTVTGLSRPLSETDCLAPVLLSAADVEIRARR
jgi:beta-mannosidase